MNTILENLNEKQLEAVTSPEANLIILAGAGSGKTRVLTHRIAWLCTENHVSPNSILAVTFTNKAAHEMRHRVEKLLGFSTKTLWIGTFHGLAHRLLRMHWRDANLAEHFQILDSDDQLRVIKRVIKNMNLNEDKWQPRQVQGFINSHKDEGRRPHNLQGQQDFFTQTLVNIYAQYEEACKQNGVIDFAEILLRAYELWQKHPEILQHYQQRFRHVLVDEFQDTNTIQYAWIKLLIAKENFLMVVGDDDQSIYGWRGAKMENLHKVEKDFTKTTTIRLEQNYRSSGTILKAANALIENNSDRLGKNLWTQDSDGERITIYSAFNEIEESHYIIDVIKQWINQGNNKRDVAILYRSNAQSRVLEEALISTDIPYHIYGGLRFFERAEIKDALAYLRLIINRDDDSAFERIINTPTRGIGNTTLDVIREFARDQQLSLWQAMQMVIEKEVLAARALNALKVFVSLIQEMAEETVSFEPGEMAECVIQKSGLYDHYRKEKGEKGQARIENLEELVSAARQYQPENTDIPILQAFLSHAALEAGDNQSDGFTDSVQLMTLHSAKGLEFPLVILSGMEEGLFPSRMSFSDPTRIEEERRLCYVGLTRAMKKCHLTYAESRRLHGELNYMRPSRFIGEIPSHLIDEVRLKTKVSLPLTSSSLRSTIPSYSQTQNAFGINHGAHVSHDKFGEGIVLAIEGKGENARVQVKFAREGTKWLLATYLNRM